MANSVIRIQQQDFDVAEEYARLSQGGNTGAVVTFVGRVRTEDNGRDIASLTLEHYPGMTEKTLQAVADQAHSRWSLSRISIIHRVGKLNAGEQIVFIGVSSAHRAAAFAACEFLIDILKTNAMLWKKQTDTAGISQWLEQKNSDAERGAKWKAGS